LSFLHDQISEFCIVQCTVNRLVSTKVQQVSWFVCSRHSSCGSFLIRLLTASVHFLVQSSHEHRLLSLPSPNQHSRTLLPRTQQPPLKQHAKHTQDDHREDTGHFDLRIHVANHKDDKVHKSWHHFHEGHDNEEDPFTKDNKILVREGSTRRSANT